MLDINEISKQMNKIDAANGTSANLKFLSAVDVRNLPEMEWLVKDLVPKNSFGVLYGKAGAKKSFAALDVALSLVTGRSVFNAFDCKSGGVVYIYSEGRSGLRQRLASWEADRGVEVGGNIQFLCTSLSLADQLNDLIVAIKSLAFSPTLIIIDTLARNFGGGDENNTKDMNGFVKAVDTLRAVFECTAMVVHHAGKNDAQGARGSSVLKAAADFELSLKPYKPGSMLLSCEKQKDGEQIGDVLLTEKKIGRSLTLNFGGWAKIEAELAAKKSEDAELVEALKVIEGVKGKKDFSERLDCSAATAARRLKSLLDRQWVGKTEDAYVITATGQKKLEGDLSALGL